MQVRTHILSAVTFATLLLGMNASHADIYDFDYKRVNDARKAYRICKFSNYQDGDCPKVWEKCHLPPLIDWDGDSKCRKPPRFTNKNDDANQALRDGHNMLNGRDEEDGERPAYDEHSDEAFALDDATTQAAEDPCELAGDRQACAETLVHDAGGLLAYEADVGPISDDPHHAAQMAVDNDQFAVAERIGAYISFSQSNQPVSQEELIEDNSHLDELGNSADYDQYEDLYNIPTLDPAPETPETIEIEEEE